MMKVPSIAALLFSVLFLFKSSAQISAQEPPSGYVVIDPEQVHQSVTGFGASLAYYENWLYAHPGKSEIYEAIFGELSLDILRVRNAHDYDSTMIERVSDFMQAAELSLGTPIKLLSTSWGPPAYLKSNLNRKNGGTLKFDTSGNGVEFYYAEFAHWWANSLDEYNQNGIYPTFISIQNEPDFTADWESCRLDPAERMDATDTIAGYNKALHAVFDTLQLRENKPVILGPETVGIGYNSVENYMNALDPGKLGGIAHHLYHGVDENDPYLSNDFQKVGNLHPELPHFQTEFSRGDWFSLAGLIYRSFHDEQVVAYLYWDLIWNEGGLVTVEFPWDSTRWTDPAKGYIKTKDFYAFKQFSAFIHPGWDRLGLEGIPAGVVSLAFKSPGSDSLTCVLINRSVTDHLDVHLSIAGFGIDQSEVYITSASLDCELSAPLEDSLLTLPPHSIVSVLMELSPHEQTDTQAPSVPGKVIVTESGTDFISGSWDPSTDNVGVVAYQLYLNDALVDSTADTFYVFSGLSPGTDYIIRVSARDSSGNVSGKSSPILARTLPVGVEPITMGTVRVFPNPGSGDFFIEFSTDQIQDIDILILDLQGRVLRKESMGRISAGDLRIRIPRGELKAGPYVVRLENSLGQVSITRIILLD